MAGAHAGDVAAFVVAGALSAGVLAASFLAVATRTPAGIVRRLVRSGRPITVRVNHLNLSTWDPSQSVGFHEIYVSGTATYSLDNTSTVHLRFEPRRGSPFERTGPIPARLIPMSAEARRRQRIARAVVGAYLSLGIAGFATTTSLVEGSDSFRVRCGGAVGFGAVASAWLITHAVIVRRRQHTHQPKSVRSRHPIYWLAGIIVISALLGVAWHLQASTDAHPPSWASSFLDAVIFVAVSAATIAAASHHHTYINHDSAWDRREG